MIQKGRPYGGAGSGGQELSVPGNRDGTESSSNPIRQAGADNRSPFRIFGHDVNALHDHQPILSPWHSTVDRRKLCCKAHKYRYAKLISLSSVSIRSYVPIPQQSRGGRRADPTSLRIGRHIPHEHIEYHETKPFGIRNQVGGDWPHPKQESMSSGSY